MLVYSQFTTGGHMNLKNWVTPETVWEFLYQVVFGDPEQGGLGCFSGADVPDDIIEHVGMVFQQATYEQVTEVLQKNLVTLEDPYSTSRDILSVLLVYANIPEEIAEIIYTYAQKLAIKALNEMDNVKDLEMYVDELSFVIKHEDIIRTWIRLANRLMDVENLIDLIRNEWEEDEVPDEVRAKWEQLAATL